MIDERRPVCDLEQLILASAESRRHCGCDNVSQIQRAAIEIPSTLASPRSSESFLAPSIEIKTSRSISSTVIDLTAADYVLVIGIESLRWWGWRARWRVLGDKLTTGSRRQMH